jgi:hypothetical protein
MTVNELITKLEEFNGELRVYLTDEYFGEPIEGDLRVDIESIDKYTKEGVIEIDVVVIR